MFDNLEYIVSRLQQRLEGGESTDDGRVDFDLLKDAVHSARGAYILTKFKSHAFVPKGYYQKICCIEVKCREIECDGVSSGVKEYYAEVPEVMTGLGRKAFGFVGTGDMKRPFDYAPTITTSPKPMPYGGYIPLKYSIEGNNKLVFNCLPTDGMKFICVEAIYNNPEDPIIKECGKGAYPIAGGDAQFIEDIAYERYREMLGIPPDQSNDAAAN